MHYTRRVVLSGGHVVLNPLNINVYAPRMISLLITLVSHSIIMKVDLFTFFLQDLIKLCVDKAEGLRSSKC